MIYLLEIQQKPGLNVYLKWLTKYYIQSNAINFTVNKAQSKQKNDFKNWTKFKWDHMESSVSTSLKF